MSVCLDYVYEVSMVIGGVVLCGAAVVSWDAGYAGVGALISTVGLSAAVLNGALGAIEQEGLGAHGKPAFVILVILWIVTIVVLATEAY